MQNANDFIENPNALIDPAIYKYPVHLNKPFSVAVALQFLAEYLPDAPQIKLVNTIDSAGYNSYMTLYIPADALDYYEQNTAGFDFESGDIKLDNDTYAIYFESGETNNYLKNQIPDSYSCLCSACRALENLT